MVKTTLLKVGITNNTSKDILEYVLEVLKKGTKKVFGVTPNPEILVYANSHSEFRTILNKADLALPDGVGVMLGARLLGKPLQERITGIDFMQKLCEQLAKQPITVGFLGAQHGVAERVSECLKKKYPGLKVGFVGEEWPQDTNTLSKIPKTDVLFVAFGFPKQEEWIYKNLPSIPVQMAIGVGGAFDYISGNIPRAPQFMRSVGLEWLFRLVCQPWRIKRQLALVTFIFLILKEKFTRS